MNAIKLNKRKSITVPARPPLEIETKREKEYEKFANDRIREQSHFAQMLLLAAIVVRMSPENII